MEEGEWWCKQHAPSTDKRKMAERHAKWDAEDNARREKRAREATAYRVLGVVEAMQPELERQATDTSRITLAAIAKALLGALKGGKC